MTSRGARVAWTPRWRCVALATASWSAALGLAGCPPGDGHRRDAGTASGARPSAAPAPLEPLARVEPGARLDGGADDEDELARVAPFSPRGEAPPPEAVRLVLEGEGAGFDEPGARLDGGVDRLDVRDGGAAAVRARAARASAVLVVPRPDTMLVQAADWLAVLDDAGSAVWLGHPDRPLAFPLALRDEPAYRRWLDELVAGKVRVIQRSDGFELQTNVGKLPGPDRNGPTIPPRGGRMDLATLRRGLEKVRGRFSEAPDVCFVPSFGTELADVARALAANYDDSGHPHFPRLCLVYPRPPDGRGGPDASVPSGGRHPP